MSSYRYICSFVLTNNNICLDSNQYAELSATYVHNVRNGIPIIKLTDQYENDQFIKLNDFGNAEAWQQFYLNDFTNQVYLFRPVYRINHISEKPILIRLYMLFSNDVSEKFGTLSMLRNEQTLIDLMLHYKNDIIIENCDQIRLVQNYLDDHATRSRAPNILKFQIPQNRTVSPEQRADAQKLLEYVQLGAVRFEFSNNIPIINGYNICLNSGSITNAFDQLIHKSFFRGSVIYGIMGCGRKRMYVNMIEQILAGNLEKNNVTDINHYYAEKCALIVCNSASFPKWKEELVNINYITLSDLTDFDNLTYSFVNEGGVILLDEKGLTYSYDSGLKELNMMREVIRYYLMNDNENTLISLDNNQLVRFHVKDISKRFTNAKIPLQWLHFRTVIIDDIFDMNEFDFSRADYLMGRYQYTPHSSIIDDLSLFSWDWSFVHVKTSGYVPTHLPKDWLNVLSPILSDPQECGTLDVYDKPALFWKQFHVYGCLQSLVTPISILRKVSLITVPIEISDQEIILLKRMNSMIEEVTERRFMYNDSSLALLGLDLYNVKGFNLPLTFHKMSNIFTIDEAVDIAEKHFQNLNGSIAERIQRLTMQGSSLCDRVFFFNSLKEAQNKCLICFENDYNVIALCGHKFCKECSEMLREKSVVQCPACRAKISDFDWLKIGKTSFVSNFSLSKIKILKQKIEQVSSRKRSKRQEDNKIMVLCPDKSKDVIKNVVNNNLEVLEFNEFIKKYKKEKLEKDMNAVFLVSPCQNSELYQMLVKSTQSISPLQVFMLYANSIESPDVALETLVNPLCRSGTRRKRSDIS